MDPLTGLPLPPGTQPYPPASQAPADAASHLNPEPEWVPSRGDSLAAPAGQMAPAAPGGPQQQPLPQPIPITTAAPDKASLMQQQDAVQQSSVFNKTGLVQQPIQQPQMQQVQPMQMQPQTQMQQVPIAQPVQQGQPAMQPVPLMVGPGVMTAPMVGMPMGMTGPRRLEPCRVCGQNTVTQIRHVPGCYSFLWLACMIVFFIPLCCIPVMDTKCMDAQELCPHCGSVYSVRPGGTEGAC